jgi:hypothetical protein
MKKEPIKSQEEANKVFTYLVDTTTKVLKIERLQAEKRVRALLDSGILDGGSPDDPITQRKIDEFLQKQID